MIRRTLGTTKKATLVISLPNSKRRGMPTPTGTGFFVSPDGWFVTAAHVVTTDNTSQGPLREDMVGARLEQERRWEHHTSAFCVAVSIDFVDAATDFALLKVDFAANSAKEWLKGQTGFPFITISKRDLQEGEPVYAFGYPLSESSVSETAPGVIIGTQVLSPRVTSAIISSTIDIVGPVITSNDPKHYVLDKALNYGNSGGPIIAAETGYAHALCSRFQPVGVPQHHLTDQAGNPLIIAIPSLYGVVSSLGNPAILDALQQRGVPLVDT